MFKADSVLPFADSDPPSRPAWPLVWGGCFPKPDSGDKTYFRHNLCGTHQRGAVSLWYLVSGHYFYSDLPRCPPQTSVGLTGHPFRVGPCHDSESGTANSTWPQSHLVRVEEQDAPRT
eukprot:3293810-Rhodomonas_salina.1